MIVRLNQIDPDALDLAGGWDDTGPRGPILCRWPESAFAYQLEAVEEDEHARPTDTAERRDQLRRLLPIVVGALLSPGERLVVRLDGPLGTGGLAAAVAFAADPAACRGYALSATHRFFGDGVPAPLFTVRLVSEPERLESLCRDEQLALHRHARLRAFALPEPLVNPMLDTQDLDDERWRDLLPAAGFVLSTAADGLSLLLCCPTLSPAMVTERIGQALGAPA